MGKEDDKPAAGAFYMDFANQLMGNRGYNQAWRLQYLSDLSTLPDYEDGYYGDWYYYGRGGGRGGAGERGRHAGLPQAAQELEGGRQRRRAVALVPAAWSQEADTGRSGEVKFLFAQFLQNQFGVQTMADYGWYFGRGPARRRDGKKDESGTWALHTLGEDETIAKLATGIKRFKLPDEFNYIKIFRDLADARRRTADKPIDTLARDLREPPAVPQGGGDVAAGDQGVRRRRPSSGGRSGSNQIVGNWGLFEPVMTQPAGAGRHGGLPLPQRQEGQLRGLRDRRRRSSWTT